MSALGAGGMGEVYRARDTTLGRDVALKILPAAFNADPDRIARFRREAQVLATLNHPHIAAIYGVEDADGCRALILELVDGPTLADRITEGPLSLEDTIIIARQICDALEAAHDGGIVHRDLKPANIKLRRDGTVKVLDFGLAKALEAAPVETGAGPLPTITSPAMTRLGVILGTAAYMSPEQAKGRPADRRSDIWAFGCVLYEMLTGRRPFVGDDVSDTMAAVLRAEPDWSLLPPAVPPSIRRLLRRCLDKDRRRRLADIADARLELDAAQTEDAASGRSAIPIRQQRRLIQWLPWGVAALSLVVVASVVANTALNTRPRDAHVYRTSIIVPAEVGAIGGNRNATLALSPDGRQLAFTASDTSGHTMLWIRALDALNARPLPDTQDAVSPLWSPDGRWLAFVANDALKRIEIATGRVTTVCNAAWAAGAWSRGDVIVFTTRTWSLAQVPAAGGTPIALTTIDPAGSEYSHLAAFFLPDGRRFVYAALASSGQPLGVYLASLDSHDRQRLAIDAAFLQLASDSLMFVRGTTLMAQPFDAVRGTLRGDAVPIADQLRATANSRFFAVSETGVLVFQTDSTSGYELNWFDREGKSLGTVGTAADYTDLSLSPDDRRAIVTVGEPGTPNRDVWIFDVVRGIRTRFTSDPAPETHGAWSPKGDEIVFDSRRTGHVDLFRKGADGARDEELLYHDDSDKNPVAWSPDGQFILYIKRSGATSNIWALPLTGERKPFALTHSEFNVSGSFSPDGRWFVYFSRDSGRSEVYVAPFPGPGERQLISIAGGLDPRWRRDGKEILYMEPATTKLMAASVNLGPRSVVVRDVRRLFDLPKVTPRWSYDITADGRRILALTRERAAGSAPLTVVVNWPALLNR